MFVNMTAAWCVTCLVNERVAIGTTAVRQAFAANGVTYLKGDWTRQDPAITEFLRQNGRDGVPLYVFYPAHGGAPQVLPQILTEGQMLGLLRAPHKPRRLTGCLSVGDTLAGPCSPEVPLVSTVPFVPRCCPAADRTVRRNPRRTGRQGRRQSRNRLR